MRLDKELKALTADIVPALEDLQICAFLLDRDGKIRWLSKRLEGIYGDLRGRGFWSVVAPGDREKVKSERTQKLLGVKRSSMYDSHLMLPDGTLWPVEINSVSLDDGSQVVGFFGVLDNAELPPAKPLRAHDKLTPRQQEVLRLLGTGLSTKQMAKELHLSVETVRSHIRALFNVLGVHSRLEAIAIAHTQGLL